MKKTYVLLTVVFSVFLSGCSMFPTIELSGEQSALVSEYAANLLLKYESGHANGLEAITDDPIVIEEAKEEEQKEQIKAESERIDSSIDRASTNSSGNATLNVTAPPFAEALGIAPLEIEYVSYEVCDIYPSAEDSDELVFSMQALSGHKLLVFHYNLTNPTADDIECNVFDQNYKFRAWLNDSERINEQTTILLNDLTVYKDTVPAGQTVDVVIVFEIDENLAANLSSEAIILKTADAEYTYPL